MLVAADKICQHRLKFSEEGLVLPPDHLIKLIRSGEIRYDVRTKDKNWVKVVEIFLDTFSSPWIHPKPPGLRVLRVLLSNGLEAFIHNWICVEFDDELKWFVKK